MGRWSGFVVSAGVSDWIGAAVSVKIAPRPLPRPFFDAIEVFSFIMAKTRRASVRVLRMRKTVSPQPHYVRRFGALPLPLL
jgi:hypothetical protein